MCSGNLGDDKNEIDQTNYQRDDEVPDREESLTEKMTQDPIGDTDGAPDEAGPVTILDIDVPIGEPCLYITLASIPDNENCGFQCEPDCYDDCDIERQATVQ
jgi:hypothetical protein